MTCMCTGLAVFYILALYFNFLFIYLFQKSVISHNRHPKFALCFSLFSLFLFFIIVRFVVLNYHVEVQHHDNSHYTLKIKLPLLVFLPPRCCILKQEILAPKFLHGSPISQYTSIAPSKLILNTFL